MSKQFEYSQAEDTYIRLKLDELAKAGRLLETTDAVFDYLDERLGTTFSDYFDGMPRVEQRRIVTDHKQKYHDYQARPGLATAAARGPPPSDSAYGSRVSGPPGIERLRQADEDSVRFDKERDGLCSFYMSSESVWCLELTVILLQDCVNDTFEIFVVISSEQGERMKPLRARYDDRNSANFMCLTTARDLFGMTMNLDLEIPIRWHRTKDDPDVRRTRCRLRLLTEKENEDVNVVFGSEVSRPGSTVVTEPPAVEGPELEAYRANLRARNAALMVEQLTELDMQKFKQSGR